MIAVISAVLVPSEPRRQNENKVRVKVKQRVFAELIAHGSFSLLLCMIDCPSPSTFLPWAIVIVGRLFQTKPLFGSGALAFPQPGTISKVAELFRTSQWLVERLIRLFWKTWSGQWNRTRSDGLIQLQQRAFPSNCCQQTVVLPLGSTFFR